MPAVLSWYLGFPSEKIDSLCWQVGKTFIQDWHLKQGADVDVYANLQKTANLTFLTCKKRHLCRFLQAKVGKS